MIYKFYKILLVKVGFSEQFLYFSSLVTAVFIRKAFQLFFSMIQMENVRFLHNQKKPQKLEKQMLQSIFQQNDKDVEDSSKYKLIMPSLYVLGLISLFLGPFYFPAFNQLICFTVLLIASCKYLMFGLVSFYLLYQNFRVINRVKAKNIKKREEGAQEVYHAIIIPNYKQHAQLIEQTLNVLANHRNSRKSYFVYLAMQKHEEGSDLKAQSIINNFKNKFRHIDYTCHEIQPGEYKGKGSNVSWCAEHLQQKFKQMNLSTQNLYLTVMDVDSWMHEVYFDEVEDHIYKNWNKKDKFVYLPYQMFTRNQLEVPAITRVFDHQMSAMNCVNTFTFSGFSFAVSNYTIGFKLLKRTGFWDKSEQAIAQDYHFMQKMFWQTKGEAQAVPIYVPFNQLNLQTGLGYWQDLNARFWQAQRHARMYEDIPFTIKMLKKQQLNKKTAWMTWVVFETLGLIAFLPLIFLSVMFQQRFMPLENRGKLWIPQQIFSLVANLVTVGSVIFLLNFQIMKRRSTRILFNLKNQSIFRLIEFFVFHFPCQYLILLPTCIYSVFAGLKKNREWFLSGKASVKTKTA